uniref:Ubiquitin-like domain-containing protein n=1 Tax=Solanum lycopersicum TaxID=4081 RepID=A0A3Q7J773_SOLLC
MIVKGISGEETLSNVAITAYSRNFDTIKDVKYRIGIKEGENSKKFSLIHDGDFLEDDKTFYKIDAGSTLLMISNLRDQVSCFPW